MLLKLRLNNFRCFRNSVIPFRPTTIVVGANNAGKSTIVEALRLIAIVVNRGPHLSINQVPKWLDKPKSYRGVFPSLDNEDFNLENVFHRYGEPPATITAEFSSGASVVVFIGGPDRLHGVFIDKTGVVASSSNAVRRLELGPIGTLPQISPLREVEMGIDPARVKKLLSSTLASKHFRNQLLVLGEKHFEDFKSIAESTWHGLQVLPLQTRGEGRILELQVRNDDFVTEVGWTGHGLQMWLQTMWFLARCREHRIIILDEPDVYMHADLQRRLVRTIKGRYPQVIIATHSIEIMDEVDPENILVVDRDKRRARFAGDIPAVQDVIGSLGGVHNIQLARLWNARRCLFIEGDDVRILRKFQDVMFGAEQEGIEIVPKLPVGGWSGWPYVVGSVMLMAENIGHDITSYCLFDRDYHTPKELQARLLDAQKRNINLHIWSQKEIENFSVAPLSIYRLISARVGAKNAPSIKTIEDAIFRLAGELKDVVMDSVANELFLENRAAGLAAANNQARAVLKNWERYEERVRLVSGKELISKLSKWAQREFEVSFNSETLAGAFAPNEVPNEMRKIVTAIVEAEPF